MYPRVKNLKTVTYHFRAKDKTLKIFDPLSFGSRRARSELLFS